jgi:hypothetical protein
VIAPASASDKGGSNTGRTILLVFLFLIAIVGLVVLGLSLFRDRLHLPSKRAFTLRKPVVRSRRPKAVSAAPQAAPQAASTVATVAAMNETVNGDAGDDLSDEDAVAQRLTGVRSYLDKVEQS